MKDEVVIKLEKTISQNDVEIVGESIKATMTVSFELSGDFTKLKSNGHIDEIKVIEFLTYQYM